MKAEELLAKVRSIRSAVARIETTTETDWADEGDNEVMPGWFMEPCDHAKADALRELDELERDVHTLACVEAVSR